MRKLLALLILSFALLIGGTDFGVAPVSSTETMLGDGGSVLGPQTIGHNQGTPRRWAPMTACASVEPVIHIIELSAVSDAAVNEFWGQMLRGGECKEFPSGLTFWADEVVSEMRWGDGDLMYIVKGHDSTDFTVYVWLPASKAEEYGVPPPGTSELIPSI